MLNNVKLVTNCEANLRVCCQLHQQIILLTRLDALDFFLRGPLNSEALMCLVTKAQHCVLTNPLTVIVLI